VSLLRSARRAPASRGLPVGLGPRAPSAVKAAIETQACVLCTEPAICGHVSLTRHFLRLLPLTHRPFGCIARPAEAVLGEGSEDAVLIGNKRFAFLLFFSCFCTRRICAKAELSTLS
jgi:hypothetical protein